MIAEAMKWIEQHAQPTLVEVDGKKLSNAAFAEIRPKKFVPGEHPALVKVSTLQGFADLVRGKIDGEKLEAPRGFDALPFFDYSNAVIHVENETTVALYSKITDANGKRVRLIEASPVPFDKFPFNKFLTQEEFVIAVSSRFADTDDKAYVLKIAGSLTNDASHVSEDDGFSQKATVKAGMKIPETVTLKPMVELAPYRTFPEVRQVVSKFVFRARPGDQPALMLVEADGGAWKIDAMNEIRSSLAGFTLDITIVA